MGAPPKKNFSGGAPGTVPASKALRVQALHFGDAAHHGVLRVLADDAVGQGEDPGRGVAHGDAQVRARKEPLVVPVVPKGDDAPRARERARPRAWTRA